MNIISIKSFWNNRFDKGCDKEKLLASAKDDINQLLGEIEKLQDKLNAKIMFVSNGMEEEHYALQEKVIRYEKALDDIYELSTFDHDTRFPKEKGYNECIRIAREALEIEQTVYDSEGKPKNS